ncbi:MAG: Thiol:disulfide interchange protein DsbD [Syntrophomonadaceae bacterium]|nr:Thiol:disulfide interchange protein DsbD [Candidatus Psychracetigena formicireducens]MBT9143330.1 Thiol:disulfide interchange protein DsbD [Bacillota bacterium]MBT9148014.1 Thiol:disulfide interchange protein DsbD [Bacillota bacterium]
MENFLQGLESYLVGAPLFAYIAVFVGGVLTSLTPCVYPVIPIMVGYIGSRGEKSKWRAFLLSLFYVIGMAITYAALGAFAALSGRLFGEIQSSPLVNLIVANIIILLGLSLLGVFPLPLPSFLKRSGAKKGKGLIGAFSIGLASGCVAAPCTAAVMGALLAYVATRRNLIFGATLLWTFSMGMGMLLILIGTFTGILAALPKSGPWMERIQQGFGYFMLGLGQYFLIQAGKLWL